MKDLLDPLHQHVYKIVSEFPIHPQSVSHIHSKLTIHTKKYHKMTIDWFTLSEIIVSLSILHHLRIIYKYQDVTWNKRVFFLEFTVNISITYHNVNNQFKLISNSMLFGYCHREFSINQLSLSGMDFSLFYWKLTKLLFYGKFTMNSLFLSRYYNVSTFLYRIQNESTTKIGTEFLHRKKFSNKTINQVIFTNFTENNQMINHMI